MTPGKLACACMLAVPCAFTTAFATGTLRHDLFARPPLGAQASFNRTNGTDTAEPVASWNPKLTALLVAGRRSLADVQGTIITIGESVDGYRLLFVRDNAAVFVKDDQIVVLTMPVPGATGSIKRGGK
jgi:hypothetical protein